MTHQMDSARIGDAMMDVLEHVHVFGKNNHRLDSAQPQRDEGEEPEVEW